jgi:predicted metal-dependent HD superfamily phosphohydrolase
MDYQWLLDKWNLRIGFDTLLGMWNESHRGYHNLNHLNDLIGQINEDKSKYSEKEYEKLIITSLFHDCVYDPMRSDNEEKSSEFFIGCVVDKSNSDVLEVKQMILDTKTHQDTTSLSESFNRYDMSIVERDFDQLMKWEDGIRFEFEPVYGYAAYKIGRLQFLDKILDKYPNNTENLLKLIDFIRNS